MSGTQSKAKLVRILGFSQSVQNGLGAYAVGVWSFDEGSGTTAKDGSGYGSDGAINGAIYSSDTPHLAAGRGTGKYALSFDGSNDYVSTPITSAAYTAVTEEVWIKADTGDWHGRIVTKGGGRFSLQKFTTNTIIWELSTAGGNLGTSFRANFQENVWTHVVVTYDGSTAKLYINGELKKTQGGLSGAIVDIGDNLTIGADNGGGYAFRGLIDEVRIYEKALALGQIQQHYAEGLERKL
ncbi:MAG: LamG domain-containing protein [Candidatus Nealsonbacteria bacterium]|nr:LamG domain-containing protein [Candidatus Nealsonbacteria bacterium]